jgi:hypothetical protein
MRFYRIHQKKIINNFFGNLRNAGNEFINKELAFILGPFDVFSVYLADTKKSLVDQDLVVFCLY